MDVPQRMKVARIAQPGAARFELDDAAVPTPGPGQVLIRVESCGVNFSDVKRRRGDVYPFETAFPFVPGAEIAGSIVAVGPGVDGLSTGSRVFALAGAGGSGGYAQFALSYARTVAPIPAGLSFDVASVLLVAGTTAKLILRDVARLAPGETVLVPAATGGVGSFALQIARRRGAAKVIALVGHESKRARAMALGAHDVVVCESDRWPDAVLGLTDGRGVDVALESNGGASLEQTLRCLASFGRLVVYGASNGRSATLSGEATERFLYAPAPNQALLAFNLGGWFSDRSATASDALGELIAEVAAGHIVAPEIRAMPLASAAQAHALLEDRKVSGKLVLEPWS